MAQRIGSTGQLRFKDDWKGVALHRWANFLEVAGELDPRFLQSFNEKVSRRIDRPDLRLEIAPDGPDIVQAFHQLERSVENAYLQAAPHIVGWLKGWAITLEDNAADLICRFLADPLVQLDQSRRDPSTAPATFFYNRRQDIAEKRDIADWSQHAQCWQAVWQETWNLKIPSDVENWIPLYYLYKDLFKYTYLGYEDYKDRRTRSRADSLQELLGNASSYEFEHSLGVYDPLVEERERWEARSTEYLDTIDKTAKDLGATRPSLPRESRARKTPLDDSDEVRRRLDSLKGAAASAGPHEGSRSNAEAPPNPEPATRVAKWMVRALLLGEPVPDIQTDYARESKTSPKSSAVERALERLAKEMCINW